MNLDDITVRFLTSDDTESYFNIIKKQDTIFKVPVDNFKKSTLESCHDILTDRLTKTVGAFYNENLIGVLSGTFPEQFAYWYIRWQYFDTIDTSIGSFKKSGLLFLKLVSELLAYAEANGYYSFYSRRSLEHQQSLDKVFKYGEDRLGIDIRYDCYYEYVYDENEPCKYAQHDKVYFKGKTFPIKTVVCKYMLKPQYREKLLNM